MANSTEQDKEYRGIFLLILYISFAILVFHFYVFCHQAVIKMGLPLQLLDHLIRNINKQLHVFNQVWYSKLVALFGLLVYTIGNKARKNISATWKEAFLYGQFGLLIYFGSNLLLTLRGISYDVINGCYIVLTVTGFMLLMKAFSAADSILNVNLMNDPHNKDNESFMQETELKDTEYSINLRTKFYFKGKYFDGWVNVLNPFRGGIVLGTPGSGKSFAIVNNYIKQQIRKGYTMYIYDFKFPDLSRIALKYLTLYKDNYPVTPKFYYINFDDPRRSHRCNPLLPELMTDIIDADESSKTIMLNLNKTWIEKEGDFFVASPISFLRACIWYMKRYHDRKVKEYLNGLPAEKRNEKNVASHINYCTFPHVIEFAARMYDEIFPLMYADPELENIIKPFYNALKNGAAEQLEGQIASALIPLASLSGPSLYWVMSGNDFSLDINNPEEPKILCCGNNPDRQTAYGAALGLFNARLVKLVNRKGRQKCSIIVDELPTIYFRGLDNLIATGRSNKISILLGLQDLSQLIRDYGDKVAKAIFNTVGNIFSGQVMGETAKTLSSRFGKVKQMRQSINVTEKETTTNFSTQYDVLITESTISSLSQGHMVGSVADNFDETIEEKRFHAEIVINKEMLKELEDLPEIPILPAYKNITPEQMDQKMYDNFLKIKQDIDTLVEQELNVLRSDVKKRQLLRGLVTEDPNYLTGEDQEEP